ncbi:MAG: DNA polymerase III subunit delta [Gammaproteobacteria bacterium]|nr:DNA polymerase III subunit delta [Gammaproteobacteria bacterium]
MKITPQQLERHLASNLGRCYLVAGDEILLAQESVDQLRTAAKLKGFTERKRLSTDTTDWHQQLQTETTTLSLFSEKRLIEIDCRNTKFNAGLTKQLQSVVENIPAETIFIFQMNKIDSKSEQAAWYKAFDKAGIILTIWPISREQLPQWIEQRARKLNLSFSRKNAAWLAQQVEGNLLAAANELEKLTLWQTDQADENALENMITEQSRFDIFQLTEAAMTGDASRALRIFHTLLNTNTENVLILWAITRELRILTRIITEHTNGKSLAGLFQSFYVREKSKPGYQAFIKHHNPKSCEQLLLLSAKVDRTIKGAERGNTEDLLEGLILAMAGNDIMVAC